MNRYYSYSTYVASSWRSAKPFIIAAFLAIVCIPVRKVADLERELAAANQRCVALEARLDLLGK